MLVFVGVAQAGFRVTPYVQNPAVDAMTVIWLSDDANPGTLDVHGVGSYISTPTLATDLAYYPTEVTNHFGGVDPGPPYLHRIRVGSLSPGASYNYTVTQDGTPFVSSFQTAPPADASVRFIVYADSETEPESTGTTRRWSEPYGDWNRQYLVDQTTGYAQNINVMASRSPDFIAIAGDIVESGNEQRDWDEFWNHNSGAHSTIAASTPILPAVGNHENHSGGDGGGGFYTTPLAQQALARYRTYFETPDNGSGKAYFDDRYYRVDYGPVTYIAIDSSNGDDTDVSKDTNLYLAGEANGGEAPDFNPGSEQYQWLEIQLADAQANSQFTFVQFHHMPYSVGPHGFPSGWGAFPGEDTQSGQPMRVLTGLFAQYGVDAVFCGHDEMYEHALIDGIHFFDVGTGGDGLRGPYMGEDGLYAYPSEDPCQLFLAHLDAPETWSGDQLLSGGKHYGHMEVNVYQDAGDNWVAELSPVYVFPLMDALGNITGWQRRVYDDVTVIPEPTIPACWEYDTQCHGDADGDDDVDTVDWPVFRDAFGYAYPAVAYHPCADLDRDGDVDTADWPEFRDNFGYTAAPDCTPGGAWPPAP